MVEKLIETYNQRSGLKIAVGKEKSPKPLESLRILDLVPVTGLDLHFLPLGENDCVAAVQPAASNSPPVCCIWMGSSPPPT